MKRTILAVLALAALGGGQALAEGTLAVSDAWARPTIPTRPGAGYLTLANTGDAPVVLTGARAEGAEKIELHTTVDENGVVKMLHLESLEIAPGETVVFGPGGTHFMLMGLAEPLAEGARFTATLMFEEAEEVEVSFAVGKEPATEAATGTAAE